MEHQELVYRATATAAVVDPVAAPRHEQFSRTVVPDAVLLFQLSALTYNGHRIHSDRRYATDGEGYPGPVLHGPLIATLLVDLLGRTLPGVELTAFRFRALRATFDGAPLTLAGRRDGADVRLWAMDANRSLVMDATATIARA